MTNQNWSSERTQQTSKYKENCKAKSPPMPQTGSMLESTRSIISTRNRTEAGRRAMGRYITLPHLHFASILPHPICQAADRATVINRCYMFVHKWTKLLLSIKQIRNVWWRWGRPYEQIMEDTELEGHTHFHTYITWEYTYHVYQCRDFYAPNQNKLLHQGRLMFSWKVMNEWI